MTNKILTKTYLMEQIKGIYLILESDIGCENYIEDYIREKFDTILSGQGIEFHELIKQAMEIGKIKLVDKND